MISVGRSPARSLRENVLATTEFNLTLRVRYTLTGKDGKPLVGPWRGNRFNQLFRRRRCGGNQRQALPLAAEELAVRLVSQLSEGW